MTCYLCAGNTCLGECEPKIKEKDMNNEIIERVVTLLKDSAWDDGIIDMRVDDLIEDVRKLKGTS